MIFIVESDWTQFNSISLNKAESILFLTLKRQLP